MRDMWRWANSRDGWFVTVGSMAANVTVSAWSEQYGLAAFFALLTALAAVKADRTPR